MLSCGWHTQVYAFFENCQFCGSIPAETPGMLLSASGARGEPVLLALVLLTTAVCCLFELPALLTCMIGS